MFEGLSDRLSGILSGLTRRGALTEADVTAAMREVRRALETVGLDVNRLIRVSYGPFQLGELTPGDVE